MGKFFFRVFIYRSLLDYSQEELAEKIGVSSNTVSYIERGKNAISFTKLPQLCKALQVEPYKLFLETDIEPNESMIEHITNMLKLADKKQINIISRLIKNIMDV